MTLRNLQVFIIAAGLVFALPAVADPWKDESSHAHHHERERHEHKHWHKHGYHRGDDEDYDDEAEYDDEDQYDYRERGGPPPWAPAYGYRRKQHHRHGDTVVIVEQPSRQEPAYDDHQAAAVEFRATSKRIGISSGTCNRQAVGTVIGGIVGGVLGHNLAGHRDKQLGTVAGVLIGAIVGNHIGHNMDKADANCTNQALERAPDGQVVRWKNPNTGYQYAITPYKTYKRADGRYCRDYTAVVSGDRTRKYRETACRTDKGVWKKP